MTAPITVDRGGFRLAAYIDGQGEGAPWIILSNSLGAAAMMWEPQLELLGKRYRILRYDTRGHGASDAPTGPYSFEDLVGDVIALADHFGIARASYMGLSLGGMTGLGLAIHHAGRFERVVCCDARADNPPAFVQSWDDRGAAIDKGGLAAILGMTMERWFVESWRQAHPEALHRFEDAFLATSPTGYRGCAEALKTAQLSEGSRLDHHPHALCRRGEGSRRAGRGHARHGGGDAWCELRRNPRCRASFERRQHKGLQRRHQWISWA